MGAFDFQTDPLGQALRFRNTPVKIAVLGGKKVKANVLLAVQRVEAVCDLRFKLEPLAWDTQIVFKAKGMPKGQSPGNSHIYLDYDRSDVIKFALVVSDLRRMDLGFTRQLCFAVGMAGSDDPKSVLYWTPSWKRNGDLDTDTAIGLGALYGSQ